MFTEEEIENLKGNLEYFTYEYYEVLQERTRLSRATISKFFNNQSVIKKNQALIFDAALEIIKEQRKIKEARDEKAKKLLVPKEVFSPNLNQHKS